MNMIFPSLYEELDMQRYAGLAANLLPDSKVKTALCDDSGQIIWASNGKKKQAELIVHCHQQQCADRASDSEQRVNSETVINCNLGELSGLPAGQLVFYDIAQGVTEEIVSALHSIAEIVKAELGYLYEVNAMANELGERYDELSMLRASDLALTEYHESRHILSTYIRSCSEHLNVKYAAIWIPERLNNPSRVVSPSSISSNLVSSENSSPDPPRKHAEPLQSEMWYTPRGENENWL